MRTSLAASVGGLLAIWVFQGLVVHAHAQSPLQTQLDGHDASDAASLSSRGFLGARAGLNASEASKAAIESMNKSFYNKTAGRWTVADAWWLSGVALQDLLEYMYKTGSRDYLHQAKHIIEKQKEPLPWWPEGDGYFRADSTDDTGWWALAMIRMFDITKDQQYLNMSILDEAYMYSYWTNTNCGGGMYVDIRAETYKNAIANELYMKLAASLHNRIPGDTEYLAKAETAYNWFMASGMINGDNLINDGLAENGAGVCYNNALPIWTYNQGVILGASVELYIATQNQSYVVEARKIADAVLSSGAMTRDGVLTEPCEAADTCNNDQQIFKGIFAYNLAELNSVLSDSPYTAYLAQNAETAWSNDRNSKDLYDVSWAGPFRNSTIAKQASAVGLLVSLL
ncbi:glycoside hydrolase family 76 protein [Lasiosphaeria ovina]|uniref:Glycoside hydrolase family 76 protein n=1 Tax=Lasiosphaeria ovina TaxID=92902 RepID=A0AAE0NDD9_9PEZI|nr:glycoside hydrolase family 76 protein [Lasiosphaeria ovina]